MGKYIARTAHMTYRHMLHMQNKLFRRKDLIIQRTDRNTCCYLVTFTRGDDNDAFKKKAILHKISKF